MTISTPALMASVDDGRHRIDGQQDAAHRIGGVTADEPVGVP